MAGGLSNESALSFLKGIAGFSAAVILSIFALKKEIENYDTLITMFWTNSFVSSFLTIWLIENFQTKSDKTETKTEKMIQEITPKMFYLSLIFAALGMFSLLNSIAGGLQFSHWVSFLFLGLFYFLAWIKFRKAPKDHE